MLQKQYEKETFELEVFPDKNLFPVKKGQIIACPVTRAAQEARTCTSRSVTLKTACTTRFAGALKRLSTPRRLICLVLVYSL